MRISGHIVDVFNKNIFDGTIIVEEGKIREAVHSAVPADAPYVMPGFTDAHIHIESTLLTPENYARAAVSKGVVAVVADPHEIANVCGLEGIEFMMDNGRKSKFHFNFCAPSCVPCTTFETSGARIGHSDIAALLEKDEICAVAEFMNAFGVLTGDPECKAKLDAARRAGKKVDGHAPGMSREDLFKYAAAGISTDHECVSLKEALDHLDAGMKVIIREGSASCDFEALSPLLADHPGQLMFCSDDKYPDELMDGYIDKMVSRAVAMGYPLWNVLDAACVTPVTHYGLRHGLLRQGDSADFIIVDNLRDFNVLATFITGEQVFSSDCRNQHNPGCNCREKGWPNVFKAEKIAEEDIQVHWDTTKAPDARIKVIKAEDLSIRTGTMHAVPKVCGDRIVADTDDDILKIVVYSRYGHGRPQTAFIHGFGLKRGAMASSIAHDSHNIVAIGTSDKDIVSAINRLIELKGGIIVCDGEESHELPLPVGGLMSDLDCITVAERYRKLKKQAKLQGCPFNAAFMTLSFMCLPVIPELKLTDKGLFDATRFEFDAII